MSSGVDASAVAAGVGDLGVPGGSPCGGSQPVSRPPAIASTRKIVVTGNPKMTGCLSNHDAVVADVEPAVEARGRPRQDEQQRRHVQRQVAAAVQPDAGEREGRDAAQRSGQPGKDAQLHGHLVRVSISSNSPMAVEPASRHTGPLTAPGTRPAPQQHHDQAEHAGASSTSTANRRVSEPSTLSSTVGK